MRSVWENATAWLVGKYVIMPDHIHAFVAPGEMVLPLDNWVCYCKSQFSKKHQNPDHKWQIDYWDTRLRTWESYADKWEYVKNNPVRRGLVKVANEWPFQGQIHDLRW